MCGIFGIVKRAPHEVGRVLREALERLEYRGYDSAGIAVATGSGIVVKKGVGKVAEVSARLGFDSVRGISGLAHTRWATHGRPTNENAHPHTDCTVSIAVVHNGIIENFEELRAWLEARGHRFRSDTDTEVVPHLLEEFLKLGMSTFDAWREAIKHLRGAYALAAIFLGESERIYFARYLSPLIVAIGEDFAVVSSDITSILPYTRRVIPIRDGEYGFVEPGRVYIEHDGRPVDVVGRVVEVLWSVEEATRGGYPHYMLKEIHEQPEALASTIFGLDWNRIRRVAEDLLRARRVFAIAAGTSFHAAYVFSTAMARVGIDVRPIVSSEYSQFTRLVDRGDLVFAVSQSGETIDTIRAAREFAKRGAKIIAVVNVVGSTLDREADETLYIRAGPEIGVAATKTFTSQVALLSAVAESSAKLVGEDLGVELGRLPSAAREVIELTEGLARELAQRLARAGSMYYIGRGLGVPLAMEGALKMKEVAYIHAEAYPAGESKHGPIALVEEGFPVVVVVPDESVLDRIESNVEEMRARGARVILVAGRGVKLRANHLLETPRLDPISNVALQSIPLQLLAYYTAVERGLDPDKPRNLAKTVTVE